MKQIKKDVEGIDEGHLQRIADLYSNIVNRFNERITAGGNGKFQAVSGIEKTISLMEQAQKLLGPGAELDQLNKDLETLYKIRDIQNEIRSAKGPWRELDSVKDWKANEVQYQTIVNASAEIAQNAELTREANTQGSAEMARNLAKAREDSRQALEEAQRSREESERTAAAVNKIWEIMHNGGDAQSGGLNTAADASKTIVDNSQKS